jgi:hypothetical protein
MNGLWMNDGLIVDLWLMNDGGIIGERLRNAESMMDERWMDGW